MMNFNTQMAKSRDKFIFSSGSQLEVILPQRIFGNAETILVFTAGGVHLVGRDHGC